MSGNVLFPAAPSLCSFSFSPCVCTSILQVSSFQRCSQLFPFLSLELSRAAFIPPPRHAWDHMETPPPYDCFHTFICFKEYQLRTAYWSRVGNPPLQSNLQLMKECWGILPYFLPPPPPCPICMLTPSKPGPPLASASFPKHFWRSRLSYFCDTEHLKHLITPVLNWLSTSFRDLILKPKYGKESAVT